MRRSVKTDEEFARLRRRVCEGISVPEALVPIILDEVDVLTFHTRLEQEASRLGIRTRYVKDVRSSDYGKLVGFDLSN